MERSSAYVHAQSTCALVEALGMMSDNMQREALGHSMAYDHKAFADLIDQYGIGRDAVLETLGSIV